VGDTHITGRHLGGDTHITSDMCAGIHISRGYTYHCDTAMLVYLRGTPTLRPENIVNIWNLLWLSRRLIICTKQTSIYISTFPNTLTSKWAKNHEISI